MIFLIMELGPHESFTSFSWHQEICKEKSHPGGSSAKLSRQRPHYARRTSVDTFVQVNLLRTWCLTHMCEHHIHI
jgi:hypothetical protein